MEQELALVISSDLPVCVIYVCFWLEYFVAIAAYNVTEASI